MQKVRSVPRVRALFTLFLTLLAVAGLSSASSARSLHGTWRKVDVVGPAPEARRHSTMVYDAANLRALVFGGDAMANGSMVAYDDLWVLDLTKPCEPSWTRIDREPGEEWPPARHGHAAALLSGSPARWFVNGGRTAMNEFLDDTWELALDPRPRWHLRASENPDALDRTHHVAFAHHDSLRTFGGKESTPNGLDGSGMADTWWLSNAVPGHPWTHVSGNPTNCGPAGAPGCCLCNSTTCYCSSAIPDRRYYHSLVTDTDRGEILTHGGIYDADGLSGSNVWLSADGGLTWSRFTEPENTPSRCLHTATYDPIGHRMLVIGGYTGFVSREDIDTPGGPETVGNVVASLSLTGSTRGQWTVWTPAGTGPGHIAEHAAVYDAANDRILVFGGVDENGTYGNAVWALEFDDAAPAAVTNLAPQAYGSNWITFGWTAPGDDGAVGKACRYEIRYSASPITNDATFAAATLWPTPPTPASAGTAQSVKLQPLAYATIYYVALKAYDEAGNSSPLSNVACGRIKLPHVLCGGGGGANAVPASGEPDGVGGAGPMQLSIQSPVRSPAALDVTFSLPQAGEAALELVDVSGRRVASLEPGPLGAGTHSVRLGEGLALAPGFYVVRLRQGAAVLRRSVVVVR